MMEYNHLGIPTKNKFEGEIDLPHLRMTVSDHENNPYGIQWQRYWDDAGTDDDQHTDKADGQRRPAMDARFLSKPEDGQ